MRNNITYLSYFESKNYIKNIPDDAELLYCYFTKEYIIISKEKNENSKHKILEKNINKTT